MTEQAPPLDLVLLGYALEAILLPALAWRVARLRRYHLPIAIGLTVIGVADAARALLAAFYFAGKATPYIDEARVVFHLDEALYLAGPAALAWMAVQLLVGRGGAHVVGAAAMAWCGLIVGYPHPFRGATLGLVYLGAHGVAGLVVVSSVALWYMANRGRWMVVSGYLLLLYLAGDVVAVAGPYAGDPFTSWASSWLSLLGLHLTAVMVHIAMLLARPPAVRS
jgi:hypothetical protein